MGRLFGDSLSFARISSLRVLRNWMLVTDGLMSRHLAIVNLRSGRLEWQVGRHGQGPGEFLGPFWSIPASDEPPAAWVYDFRNRRLTRLPLDQPGRAAEWESRPLDVGVSLTQMIHNSRGLLAAGFFPDYTLLQMDSAGKPLRRIVADPPFSPRDIGHRDGRRLLNHNYLSYRPAGDRVALAYQFRSRIDFFTAEGDRYGSVEGPRQTRPSWTVRGARFGWNDENEMAFWGVHSTDRYVYALFCGCRADEDRMPSRVQVFRWNGDFVTELSLDRPVLEFTVSPDDALLYAAVETPWPAVGEFRLPRYLADADPVRGTR